MSSIRDSDQGTDPKMAGVAGREVHHSHPVDRKGDIENLRNPGLRIAEEEVLRTVQGEGHHIVREVGRRTGLEAERRILGAE